MLRQSIQRQSSRKLWRHSGPSVAHSFSKSSTRQQTIVSGIQPTGIPHLGNYLGAIQNWTNLQNSADRNDTILFSIVDLHAITVPQNTDTLRQSRREMLMSLVACGINLDRAIVFEQSRVPEHAELAWILKCLTPVGWLNRMTQWKTKIADFRGANSLSEVDESSGLCLGLYAYPVLQAADILLYKADSVPIGEDQLQHLELCRMIAAQFNKQFNTKTFRPPQSIITPTKRVKSLRDPTAKMSKSSRDASSRILITDPPDVVRKRIKSAVTDTDRSITYDSETRPGLSNLISILAGLTKSSPDQIAKDHQHLRGHADFKDVVADGINGFLAPIQAEYSRLERDGGEWLDKSAKEGSLRARSIAQSTMKDVRKVVGFD